jgi:hypothetical protein
MKNKKIKYSKTEYYDLLFTNDDLLYIIFTFLISSDYICNSEIYKKKFYITTKKECQTLETLASVNSLFYNILNNCNFTFVHYFPLKTKLNNVTSILGTLNEIAEINIKLFPNLKEIELTTLEFHPKYKTDHYIHKSIYSLLYKISGYRNNFKYFIRINAKKTKNRYNSLKHYMFGRDINFQVVKVE